jgi:hypothetical protein
VSDVKAEVAAEAEVVAVEVDPVEPVKDEPTPKVEVVPGTELTDPKGEPVTVLAVSDGFAWIKPVGADPVTLPKDEVAETFAPPAPPPLVAQFVCTNQAGEWFAYRTEAEALRVASDFGRTFIGACVPVPVEVS